MRIHPRLRPALAGGAVLLVVIGLVAGSALLGPNPSPSPSASASVSPTSSASPTPSPTPTPSPSLEPAALCPYDGMPVANADALDRMALLVQVENNPIGRPTSGLNAADLVIEAPVEGDTTRFGAVYLCGRVPEAIGPIRSARYYNTDLWRQLHLLTLHFGAGYAILREFNREGTPYVNGISGGWPFFERRASPPAPHNVYLDLALARRLAEDGAFGARTERAGTPRSAFRFNPDAERPRGRTVSALTIHTNSFWNFGWRWDAATGSWHRRDDGVLHVDALTGEPLSATSVVVQLVNQTILDEYDPGGYPRRRQHLVGSGEGILYAHGQAHDIRWSRPTAADATRFTYANGGGRVVLEPGRVWWEIIPVGSSVTER
jgi:hypothetical protein